MVQLFYTSPISVDLGQYEIYIMLKFVITGIGRCKREMKHSNLQLGRTRTSSLSVRSLDCLKRNMHTSVDEKQIFHFRLCLPSQGWLGGGGQLLNESWNHGHCENSIPPTLLHVLLPVPGGIIIDIHLLSLSGGL